MQRMCRFQASLFKGVKLLVHEAGIMEPDEIRAEIERRKQRAKDLKLRESVWSLYISQFKYIDERLRKDPEAILAEVRESLKRSNNTYDFRFKGVEYRLVYKEDKKESDRWGRD